MGSTSSQLECYLPLLPESLEIGDHIDTVSLGFEGQPFTVKNSSATNARGSACWEMPCSGGDPGVPSWPYLHQEPAV